jgi:hypothetical protein
MGGGSSFSGVSGLRSPAPLPRAAERFRVGLNGLRGQMLASLLLFLSAWVALAALAVGFDVLLSSPVAYAQGAASSSVGPVTVTAPRIGGAGRPQCPTAPGRPPSDCAALKLDQAVKAAQHAATVDPRLTVPNAASTDLTVGVGNITASGQRLGGTLQGATTLPQRPPPPPPPTSALPRRP